MPYVMGATIVVREGEEENAERILRECAVPTRQEAGIVTYDILHAARRPRQFFVYEVYRDREARDSHLASEYVQRLIVGELQSITESMEVVSYIPMA
jgi:quinol monooxygenase YgiN